MAEKDKVPVLYAPSSTTDPLDACERTDLIALPDKHSFHTPFDVTLKTQRRASKSANTFYCPVCPSSPIQIKQTPFTIACPNCHWNAADHGIETVSDLLLADSRPHHKLFQRIRVLAEQLPKRDPLHVPECSDLSFEKNEIPVERRFDARITKLEQEPARRRIKEKVLILVNGEDIGVVENGEWKLKHPGDDVLPVVEARREAGVVTLSLRNEHDVTMEVAVGSDVATLETGSEREFIDCGKKSKGWWAVDMRVVHEGGVYSGAWHARLFIK